MSRFDDLVREFFAAIFKWLLYTFAKIFFVALIITGWHLLQNGNYVLGLVVEVAGLAGLELSSWVQAKIFKEQN